MIVLIIIFPLILSGRFLRDEWKDLLEIFREDVTVHDAERFDKKSLPVGKYGRFSVFF